MLCLTKTWLLLFVALTATVEVSPGLTDESFFSDFFCLTQKHLDQWFLMSYTEASRSVGFLCLKQKHNKM